MLMIHTLDLRFLDIPQAIAAYLIETSNGPVLIESGPYSTYEALQQEVRRIGFAPEDIRHVLLTHIHFDHAGAAWALAKQGATIYVHPVGAPHLANPEKLWNSAKRIYQNEMDRLWGEMQPIPEAQLREVAHEEALTFGDTTLTAYHTPGHAIHHIAYQLGRDVFTGDVGGVRIGDEGIVEPPCPPPDINLEDWQQSIQLLHDLRPRHLYLTHFGRVGEVSEHLNVLYRQLLNWADWVHERMDGKSADEIAPEFAAYVERQLRSHGASDEQIQQYEAANPSWMSVAGLMRYWKKK